MWPAHSEAPRIPELDDPTFQTILSPAVVDEALSLPGSDINVLCSPELLTATYAEYTALSVSLPLAQAVDVRANAMLATDNDRTSDMNLTVGGALIPAPPFTPRTAEVAKARPDLQLPSFEMLGIATPHPDRIGHVGHLAGGAEVACGGLVPHDVKLPFPSQTGSKRALQPPLCPQIEVLTPPADQSDPVWSEEPVIKVPLPMDSPASNPDHTPIHDESAERAEEGAQPGQPAAEDSTSTEPATRPAAPVQNLFSRAPTWVRPAVEKLLENVRDAPSMTSNTLRVLSHALPSPSQTGHIFSKVIDDIHTSPATNRIMWLNVLHAIPGEYNLQRLPPSSPLSTPGPAIGGDDYFTKKVFDNAVPILDYQTDLKVQRPSPNRAVTSPSSVDIALVERYIPPTNVNEFSAMFDPDGPSILVDRLVELSPNNGSLVFVYPNRAGAQTFFRSYLEPVKAPTLRAFASQYSVPIAIGEDLDKMDRKILNNLPEHQQLSKGMETLCAQLTQRSPSMRTFQNKQASFAVVHEQTAQVSLDADSWLSDWWSKQEKPKLRTMMQIFAQRAADQKSDPHLPPLPGESMLAQQLVRNMETKAKAIAGPAVGVEVSIFVIKRTA